MTDQQYTPNITELIFAYDTVRQDYTFYSTWAKSKAEFFRWLAAHDEYKIREWTAENDVVPHERYTRDIAAAEQRAEQRGKEQGWDEGTQAYMNSIWGDGPEEPVNPYRADQIKEQP